MNRFSYRLLGSRYTKPVVQTVVSNYKDRYKSSVVTLALSVYVLELRWVSQFIPQTWSPTRKFFSSAKVSVACDL